MRIFQYLAFKRNLFLTIIKLKKAKINVWGNYLNFVKNENNYDDSVNLSIGDATLLQETNYDKLFQHIPKYNVLLDKYAVTLYGEEQSEFRKAVSIMQWLTDNTFYSGAQIRILPDDTLKILKYSVGKGFKHAINCRYKAIAFADLLLSNGLKAYPILLENANKTGSHFVTHAYCSDKEKWVLFDPSFNCYFEDETGNVLNVFELRDLMIKGERPNVVGYSFNGTDECKDIHIKYFIGSTLTNISTWKDNSNEGRRSKNFSKRKMFNCKLPELVENNIG